MKVDVYVVQDANKEIVTGFASGPKAANFTEHHPNHTFAKIEMDLPKKMVQIEVPAQFEESQEVMDVLSKNIEVFTEPVKPETLKVLETRYILHTLQSLDGNKTRAAKVLGITVKTLYNKLEAMKETVTQTN